MLCDIARHKCRAWILIWAVRIKDKIKTACTVITTKRIRKYHTKKCRLAEIMDVQWFLYNIQSKFVSIIKAVFHNFTSIIFVMVLIVLWEYAVCTFWIEWNIIWIVKLISGNLAWIYSILSCFLLYHKYSHL